MSNAINVAVQQFRTEQIGDEIIKILERLGFEIADKFGPDGDTCAGLIETHITSWDKLEVETVPQLLAQLRPMRNTAPGMKVSWQEWDWSDNGTTDKESKDWPEWAGQGH